MQTTLAGYARIPAAVSRIARAASAAPDAAALAAELAAVLREQLGAAVVDQVEGGSAAERPDAASALVIPQSWGGGVRRVVTAVWRSARALSEDERALAEALCAQAAAGFARLEAEAQRAAGSAQDRAIVRAARALNASLDLQEVLHTLAAEAARALEADVAVVYLGDERAGATATAGYGMGDAWRGSHLSPGEGAAGVVLATGRAHLAADYRRDTVMPRALGSDPGPRSALAVPIAWDGELRGALSIAWQARHRVRDEDVRAAEAVADLASVACRNAEAYEQVQHAARTDALTGLLNHGAMQVRIREEIARSARDGAQLACVILDLDDFKGVNDTRGHQAGDELLRHVAGLLTREVRPYDVVARYGGDEFVLLLPGSDEAAAMHVAQRVGDALGTGCSIGVAPWTPELDADKLLDQADRALLLAKRTGKGRVAVANADVERELALLQAQRGSPAAVQALAAAIEERDNYTHEHSEQVVHLARGVAMVLGMPSDQVERIAHAALLHDVGKLATPNGILHKDGPLTPDEWEVMVEHPVVGERILMRTPELVAIAPLVRHEHERWDGSGYPDGLSGHKIPLGSRIILACDAYNAMITSRPYRPAMEREEAIEQLRRGAGRQFDPEVVEALLDLLGARPPVSAAPADAAA